MAELEGAEAGGARAKRAPADRRHRPAALMEIASEFAIGGNVWVRAPGNHSYAAEGLMFGVIRPGKRRSVWAKPDSFHARWAAVGAVRWPLAHAQGTQLGVGHRSAFGAA